VTIAKRPFVWTGMAKDMQVIWVRGQEKFGKSEINHLWNKALIALYARLIAKGKAHNAALIACARKLLIYANTVVERGTPWTEKAA
jgi:hypothetical protein